MKSRTSKNWGVPPGPPWRLLSICQSSGGYLSYHYNDDLSSLPVRAVTKIGDNKADPNIETMTYGLFSTCNKIMRKSVVKRGNPYIFFVTNINGQRYLSGLYHIKWYAPLQKTTDDFCLAASSVWFVQQPISLEDIKESCRINIPFFRTYFHVSTEECKRIKKILLDRPNAIKLYLSEIDRLERFNQMLTGYRYVTAKIKEPFSWNCSKVKSIFHS